MSLVRYSECGLGPHPADWGCEMLEQDEGKTSSDESLVLITHAVLEWAAVIRQTTNLARLVSRAAAPSDFSSPRSPDSPPSRQLARAHDVESHEALFPRS